MRWLTKFLQNPESNGYPHARAKALYTQGRLLYNLEQYNQAQAATEESLALFRAVGDQQGEMDSLISLGNIFMIFLSNPVKGTEFAHQALILAQSLGDIRRQAAALDALAWDHRDFKRAFLYWEAAIALYRQAGHWGGLADSLSQLSFFLMTDGQVDAAQKFLDQSKLLFQKLNIFDKGPILISLGQIALMQDDYEQARTYFQEAIRIGKELGDQVQYLWSTVRLGYTELGAGNVADARQIFTETVQNFQKDGSRIGVVFTLEGMSGLYIAVDKPDVAARLIGWTNATREIIGDTRPKSEQADVDKIIAACIAKIGEATFSDSYDEGKKMSLDEAVSLALEER